MLYQYQPKTSLYFGHRYAVSQILLGFMAGGSYILSKKGLEKFINNTLVNKEPLEDRNLEPNALTNF